MGSSLFYKTVEEHDSVSAKLIDLFVLPSTIVKIPVAEGMDLIVKMRLLNDKENMEVATAVDQCGTFGRLIMQRRHILARAIESIEGAVLEMPAVLKQEYESRIGRKPTPIEEKLWVLELCQSMVLNELATKYEEFNLEQRKMIDDLKKKSVQLSVDPLPEMS